MAETFAFFKSTWDLVVFSFIYFFPATSLFKRIFLLSWLNASVDVLKGTDENKFRNCLIVYSLFWFVYVSTWYHIWTWNEYRSREKNIFSRTFIKQDTKSKFFEMKTEFESRWLTKHPRSPISHSAMERNERTQDISRNIFLLISFPTHEK